MSDETTENPESEEWLSVHERNKMQTKRIFSSFSVRGFFLSLILVHNKWMCFSHIYSVVHAMAATIWRRQHKHCIIRQLYIWTRLTLNFTDKRSQSRMLLVLALAWGYFGRSSHADVARAKIYQRIRFDCNEHYLWQSAVLHWMHAQIFTCKIQ